MNSKKRRQAYWMLTAGGLAVVGILVGMWFVERQDKPGPNGCYKVQPGSTVIVLDRTDPLSGQTIDEIYSRIQELINTDVVVGELVSVFTIDGDTAINLRPRFSMCKMRASGNEFYEAPEQIRRAKEELFDQPLNRVLAEPVGTVPNSPIAEALIDLTKTKYMRAPYIRLHVFSDLQQNTSALGIRECANCEQAIKRFRDARRGAEERPKFTDTLVTLHVIPRSAGSSATQSCRNCFWSWFFGDSQYTPEYQEGLERGVMFEYLPGPVSAIVTPDAVASTN